MTRRVAALVAFLLITLGLTAGIALKIQGVTFERRYHASATFDDVTGLYVGDPVKLAGVPVGQVTSIHLRSGKAQVGMSIDEDVRLPRDTTVVVRWRNLIGQRDLFVEPDGGAATSDLLPTDGSGVIQHTRQAVDIGAVLNALGPLGKAVDPRQINEIFTAIAQALDGNQASVDALIQNLDAVVATFASRSQTIGQMVTDYQSLVGVLATRDQQIATMVDNVALLSQSFTDNTQLFETALDNLGSVGTSVDSLLTQNDQQLRGILDNLSSVADLITQKLPQLEQAFGGLPAALQALFSTVNGGNFIRIDATCVQFAPAPCSVLGGYSVP